MNISKSMQPLIALAVVGVAVGALGVGFLDNEINLTDMVQQFGVGEATIETPASQAYIDFNIVRSTFSVNEFEKTRNIIDACVVQANAQLAIGTTVICKLTDINSNVVAEGIVTINPTLATRALLTVPITQFVSGNAMDIDVTNIHDVQLVIIGPSALVATGNP